MSVFKGIPYGADTSGSNRWMLDRVFEELRGKGAEIVKGPEEVFWGGYSGYFADPDGNRWEVAHNPYWTIRGDGTISMSKD